MHEVKLNNLVYRTEGKLARLTLNRPEALNAFSVELVAELDAVSQLIDDDREIRVVAITGAGRAFSAGIDLKALSRGEIDHAYLVQWERFLHRLEAVAGEARWKEATAAGERYVHFAQELDRPDEVRPIPQPAPKPPRATRPLKLSVTAIEDWLRDPYTIYAKHILKLGALDPVDMPLSAADRGSAIHSAIGEFTKDFSERLPDNPVHALREIGERHFAPLMERPEARALWWPRFQRIAKWFSEWESARRGNIDAIKAETEGKIAIPLDNERTFYLSARADRIDLRADGTFAVLDYKTGQPPTGKQVRMGLSPQLTLEAAILREGGFDGIDAGASVGELVYVRLSGNNPPGEERSLELKIKNETPQHPDDAANYARQQLEALIRKFENEDEPYRSLVLSMWTNRYGTYDDLARIKEWSAAGGLGLPEW